MTATVSQTAEPGPHPAPAPGHDARPSVRLATVPTTLATLTRGMSLQGGALAALRHHDVVRYRLGTRRYVALAHPDHVDHVLHRRRTNYLKSAEYEPIRVAAGLNLLTDEGESWAAHRGRLNPLFAKRRLDDLFDSMCEPIVEMTDELATGAGDEERPTPFDIQDLMVRMTLRVVSKALFNQDFGTIVDHMQKLVTDGMRAAELLLRFGLVGALPPPAWAAIRRVGSSKWTVPGPFSVVQQVVSGLDEGVNAVIDERLANPREGVDLLNMMLDAEGEPWPRQRVRDEALTFMLAGHETTANALAWLWYLLAINPVARDRALDEIDTVLGGRRITADDIASLPWTTACVQESQRYFSAVPVLIRTAVEDDLIDGHRVRSGTNVIIPAHVIHHDDRLWDRPEEFDPARFLPGAPKQHRSAYLPFGGGRRRCIGQTFALMEMVAIVATMSQRFVFDLVPGHPVELEQSLTLRPKHGIRVIARPRPTIEPGVNNITSPTTGPGQQPRCPRGADA